MRARALVSKSIACDILRQAATQRSETGAHLSILDEWTNEISLAKFTYDNYYLRKVKAAKNPISHIPHPTVTLQFTRKTCFFPIQVRVAATVRWWPSTLFQCTQKLLINRYNARNIQRFHFIFYLFCDSVSIRRRRSGAPPSLKNNNKIENFHFSPPNVESRIAYLACTEWNVPWFFFRSAEDSYWISCCEQLWNIIMYSLSGEHAHHMSEMSFSFHTHHAHKHQRIPARYFIQKIVILQSHCAQHTTRHKHAFHFVFCERDSLPFQWIHVMLIFFIFFSFVTIFATNCCLS